MTFVPTIYILDANVLLRLADTTNADHATAQNAVKNLRTSGVQLRTFPQAFFEFWSVATRAAAQNGLGLSVTDAETMLDFLARLFWPIPDDPAMLTYWRQLVVQYNITGKHAHDARYIASMQAHGLTQFLTFDSDFNRYAAEGIKIVHPANVTAPTT